MTTSPITLSIVVPARNSAATLRPCLAAIKQHAPQDHELIVVDNNSEDETRQIAGEYASLVLEQPVVGGAAARNVGFARARGEIIVNIDSDVIVGPTTLSRIVDFLSAHPDVSGLSGMLAKEHPHANFASQYKNLYMHYIFQRLPEKVTFLYGSIFALRRGVHAKSNLMVETDDTARGQACTQKRQLLVVLKDVQVVHLKRYTLWTLMANDFRVPFSWAVIFLHFGGWRRLFSKPFGFAHASLRQLSSIACAVLAVVLAGAAAAGAPATPLGIAALLWLMLNLPFFVFLHRERGIRFAAAALTFTFFDQLVLATGIAGGMLTRAVRGRGAFLQPESKGGA